MMDQMSNNHKKLSAEKLCKKYGDFWAVREVDLEVNKGEIVGLLGPNGAGKTTTFYMITGMIKPTEGTIHLDGMDITRKAMYQRSRFGIGYLSQDESIFRKLTVEDNLRLVLEMSSFAKEEQKNKCRSRLQRKFQFGMIMYTGSRSRGISYLYICKYCVHTYYSSFCWII